MTVGGKVDSAIESMDDCCISRAEDRKEAVKKRIVVTARFDSGSYF